MNTWRAFADAMDDWWSRWERVVGVVTALVVGLGIAVLLVVPESYLDLGRDPDRASTAPAAPPAPPRPVPSLPPPGPVAAESPQESPQESPDPLVLQPGGPAPAPVVDDVVLHTFGPVAVGSTSAPLVLEVTNPLAEPVEVRAVATPGSAAFAIGDDTCTAVVLAPRASCRIAVVFAPTAAGAERSSVDVSLRQVCTSPDHWPCGAPQDRSVTGVASSVLPSGRRVVDWTSALNDGWAPLRVEGTTR